MYNKIKEIIILSIVLYGYEIWSLAATNTDTLLKRMCGHNGDTVTGTRTYQLHGDSHNVMREIRRIQTAEAWLLLTLL
jgi:hypothetical protein